MIFSPNSIVPFKKGLILFILELHLHVEISKRSLLISNCMLTICLL